MAHPKMEVCQLVYQNALRELREFEVILDEVSSKYIPFPEGVVLRMTLLQIIGTIEIAPECDE